MSGIIKKSPEKIRKVNVAKPTNAASSEKNRAVIHKALTDPVFRKLLQEDPARALGKRQLDVVQKKDVQKILKAVKEIEVKIHALADELLCANGGPCGIA